MTEKWKYSLASEPKRHDRHDLRSHTGSREVPWAAMRGVYWLN